jgi:hypothetical protein
MELLPVLRSIWRRRLLVATGVLGAAVIMVGLGGTQPLTSTSAAAWTEVALDTPQSALAEVAPPGAETLSWRASLIAHLMATDTSIQDLARQVGVPASQVMLVDPALDQPLVATAMAQAATKAADRSSAPYALTVSVQNPLPLISIEAAAPGRRSAVHLADAAVTLLESESSPDGPFTSEIATADGVLKRQPFVVEQVAPVRVKLLSSTSVPLKPIAASLVAFVLWCTAGALLLPRFARRRPARGSALPA